MRIVIGIALALLMSGCAAGEMAPGGPVLTDVIGPVGTAARGASAPFPHESGPVTSLFGLVAWGDASIATARETAPRQGLISHVDQRRQCLVGVCRYWTRTYGTSP
jgi:hypothetical protein